MNQQKKCFGNQIRLKRTIEYQKTHYAYFVCLKESDEPIGFVGIIEVSKDVYEDTGFCITTAYQNIGIGKEIISFMKKFVFHELSGKEFLYSCFSTNDISRKLALSQGFKYRDSCKKIRDYDQLEYISENYYMNKEMFEKMNE